MTEKEKWRRAAETAYQRAAQAYLEAKRLRQRKDPRVFSKKLKNPFKRIFAEQAYFSAKEAEKLEIHAAAAETAKKQAPKS